MATLPFPAASFPLGKTTSASAAVPQGTSSYAANIDTANVTAAPPTTTVEVGSEISTDGGATWRHNSSTTMSGGDVLHNKDGSTTTTLRISGALPGIATHIRGFVTVGGSQPVTLGPGALTF